MLPFFSSLEENLYKNAQGPFAINFILFGVFIIIYILHFIEECSV